LDVGCFASLKSLYNKDLRLRNSKASGKTNRVLELAQLQFDHDSSPFLSSSKSFETALQYAAARQSGVPLAKVSHASVYSGPDSYSAIGVYMIICCLQGTGALPARPNLLCLPVRLSQNFSFGV
jgi:hypothetical protein